MSQIEEWQKKLRKRRKWEAEQDRKKRGVKVIKIVTRVRKKER